MNNKEQTQLVFRKAALNELNTALLLLKQAAADLKESGIDQWSFWLNPDENKINWIKEGFMAGEFYFADTRENELAGMFRLMKEDALYWGKQNETARYVHSLVVATAFKGSQTLS
jgi:hypothetical protein